MDFQSTFGSEYLKISAYMTFGIFIIVGILCFIGGVVPQSESCLNDSDCGGSDNKCEDEKKCTKKRRLYWLIGVGVGSVVVGYGAYRLMKSASHSKTLSAAAAFGAQANIVSNMIRPFGFKSKALRIKRRLRRK